MPWKKRLHETNKGILPSMNEFEPNVLCRATSQACEPHLPPANVRFGKVKLIKMPPVGLGGFVILWWGKLRRAMLGRVLTGCTKRRHELRRGQCRQCGACCQLGRLCPSLAIDESGLAECLQYDQPRDPTCRLYPTTASDLRDRDRISPGTKCGYYFVDKADPAERH
jgi:hypothetical protein